MRNTCTISLALVTASIAAPTAALRAQRPGTDSATAISASGFDFTIKNIMRGPELYGRPPEDVRWSADNKWIYFSWVEPGKDWREQPAPYRVRAVPGARPERITLIQRDSAAAYSSQGSLSPDRRRAAVAAGGDIYVVDYRNGSARRLTRTAARESSPVFSADGKTVFFVRDDNAYGVDLATGLTTQLTDLRTGIAPADTMPKSAQRTRLAEQQKDLFDAIRDRMHSDSVAKAEIRLLDSLRSPRAIYVGKDRQIQSVHVSPDGRSAVVILRTPSKGTPVEVPFWVTESGYTDPHKSRTKVGDAQSRAELLYVSLHNSTTSKPHLFSTDSLASYIAFQGWNSSGTDAILYAFRPDNKERILYSISSADGSLHVIESLRDTAWVGGPCSTCAGWYDAGRHIWYVSEATGFAQLYSATVRGGDTRPLTSGKWEVRDASLSLDGRTFYLTTNELSPFEEQFYSLPVAGGAMTRVTRSSGRHTVTVSPNGRLLADVYSYVNRPPDLHLMANTPGAPEAQLTRSPSDEWLRMKWLAPQIVMVPASDGAKVPAHIYRPEDVGATSNGAAVIFVHGAGYLHNVGNFWSEYPREYMFNQFLAHHGYVVIDADYRASDGYGRDWRTAIYRWMGGRDLQDEVDVSRYLTATYRIPPTRIGIYGGSYGGFMTLMALFTAPDYFGAGAALRSVTDWAHYNNGYTSQILNLPQNDTVAYRRSSPIYFASGLRGPLLMAHGMVDTNVNYQDIVRITERLIELGKANWELASYPVEDHGFVRPTSWTDEYTRIFNLFQRTVGKSAAATSPDSE
ncbi:MAG: prolyl oligopeptidase family serine peptidase [Gemmatimonadaceae bacterium]